MKKPRRDARWESLTGLRVAASRSRSPMANRCSLIAGSGSRASLLNAVYQIGDE